MLKDYEWDFCINLHKKLKEQVKGKVFTTVKNDKLLVSIQMGKTKFKTEFDNFESRIQEGITTDLVRLDVVSEYKTYIDQLYFA